jgi:hypothetical protein
MYGRLGGEAAHEVRTEQEAVCRVLAGAAGALPKRTFIMRPAAAIRHIENSSGRISCLAENNT